MTCAANDPAPDRQPRPGDSGSLAEIPFPSLLLDLYRSGFSGPLELTRNKTLKRIIFQQGAPVHSESNLASESLGVQLMDQGELSDEDHRRVSSYMERHQCREGVALLALELLKPKGLFLALKEQVRRRILETFAWSDGSYRLLEMEELKKEVQPLRSAPLTLVREGLLSHWTPDRLLADLTPHIELFPSPAETFDEAQRVLASDEDLASLLDRIDGTLSLGNTIASGFNSVEVLSTIWILTQGRFIRFEQSARDFGDESDEKEVSCSEQDDVDSEIEIEVVIAGAPASACDERSAGPDGESANRRRETTEAGELMRREVLDLLHGLEQRDFYELLGIRKDASKGEIRKAYFAAAKRFHPDALTHQGLTDIKLQAAQVFARIADANNVLGNPEMRAEYDTRGHAQEAMVDTRALARAETAYRKGEILIRMGDFRGALEYLEPAVELWPDECEYQSGLGWALHKQPKPDHDRAVAHLERAIELNRSNPVALFRLAKVLRASGEGQRSAEYLTRAKLLDPDIG